MLIALVCRRRKKKKRHVMYEVSGADTAGWGEWRGHRKLAATLSVPAYTHPGTLAYGIR